MEEGTGLSVFRKSFPTRFFDVGIAEEHAVSFATGLATQGLRPVRVLVLGVGEEFDALGSREELLYRSGLDGEGIADAVGH